MPELDARYRPCPDYCGDHTEREDTLADQRSTTTTLESDAGNGDCAHHWQIETPNGETSEGICKRCGKTRDFANYSQRKMMVRSVKSNGNGNSR